MFLQLISELNNYSVVITILNTYEQFIVKILRYKIIQY